MGFIPSSRNSNSLGLGDGISSLSPGTSGMAGAARLEGAEGRELRSSCSLRPGPHRVPDGGGKLLACAGKKGRALARSGVGVAGGFLGKESAHRAQMPACL